MHRVPEIRTDGPRTMPTDRRFQVVLIGSVLAGSWLSMQIVHEFGHAFGAWLTGGTVRKIVLLPWTLSRTELSSNPEPLAVAWAGPIIGALLPLLVLSVAATFRLPGVYLLRFFAGFCLIANGAYLAGGAVERVGDAGDLQRHGTGLWQLLAFASLTLPLGLWLWHRQGRHFGFGPAQGRVSRRAACASLAATILVVVLEMFFGRE
jgi:hypothetical protein